MMSDLPMGYTGDEVRMGEGIYPHPECMAPDGADPCAGYHAALGRIAKLEAENEQLRRISELTRVFVETLEMKAFPSGPYFFIGPGTDMRAMQQLAQSVIDELEKGDGI